MCKHIPQIMAITHEPLLSSPNGRTSLTCKAFLLTLSLATVIGLTALITLQLTTNNTQTQIPLPSELCNQSPNPASCHSIVSDVLAVGNPRPSTIQVFTKILEKSILRLDATVTVADNIKGRINEYQQQLALADCLHLMDLSRDRLMGVVSAVDSGSHTNARTLLSAVLSNHVTCLDGLDGPGRLAMEADLQTLMAFASASLAVLNSVSPSENDDVIGPVFRFPSWVMHKDRKLLEASSLDAVQANVVVAMDGSGKYKKVQDAVNSAPDGGSSRYVIYVKKGTYKEQVTVGKKKKNVMIVGDGMDLTIITGSLNVIDGATTFNSATLIAEGDGFILQDIRVQNTAGPEKHQAVALRVSADQSVINRCRLDGYQDTLYAHSLRQFYRDSSISGTVDFIFGNAAVVFQNCNLYARKPMSNQQNLVTAQGRTDPNQNTGTSIQNCQVVPSSDLVPVKGSIPTYLGRPWKEYSRTVYMQSYIDSHIVPKGWLEWSGDFALKTLFYGEYANKGPGAGTSGRVTWPGYKVITDPKVANSFTVAALIQGGSWLKSTGVAYTEGL